MGTIEIKNLDRALAGICGSCPACAPLCVDQ